MGDADRYMTATRARVRSFVASYPGAERVEVRLLNAKGKPYEGQHLDLSRPLTAATLPAMCANTQMPPTPTTTTPTPPDAVREEDWDWIDAPDNGRGGR